MTSPLDPRVLKRIEKEVTEYVSKNKPSQRWECLCCDGKEQGLEEGAEWAFNAEATRAQKLVEAAQSFCEEEGYAISKNSGHYIGRALSEYFGRGDET